MAEKMKPKAAVRSTTHPSDTRPNIPTAELESFARPGHVAGDIQVRHADSDWGLTATEFARLDDANEIRTLAQEIVDFINGIARIRLDEPEELRVGNVRRYGEGGTKDVWVFPEPIRLRLRVGTPTVLINGVAPLAESWEPDLRPTGLLGRIDTNDVYEYVHDNVHGEVSRTP
jgi:hypothetical protein